MNRNTNKTPHLLRTAVFSGCLLAAGAAQGEWVLHNNAGRLRQNGQMPPPSAEQPARPQFGAQSGLEQQIQLRQARAADSQRPAAPHPRVAQGRQTEQDEMMRAIQARILGRNGNSRQKLRYHTHNLAEAVPPQPPQPQAGRLLLPLSAYRVSSHYGLRMHPIKKRLLHHSGVDFAAPYGSPIKAAQAGYVIFAGAKGGYGNAVVVQHNPRFATLYGHAAKLLVQRGAYVRAGQVIALVGSTGQSTGPHLHFEVQDYGQAVNPVFFLKY